MNIACALRWGVASLGITLLGMTHPIRDNISGAGHAFVGDSHPRPENEESRLVALQLSFCKILK